jgi:cortical protein marker for cell polarity
MLVLWTKSRFLGCVCETWSDRPRGNKLKFGLTAAGAWCRATGVCFCFFVWATISLSAPFSDANWVSCGIPPGLNGVASALVTGTNGNVYVGGSFTIAGGVNATNIAEWNGKKWSALGLGVNGTVSALALDDFGVLCVGGSFTRAGGAAASNLAEWDGATWRALGGGTDYRVQNS